MKATIFNWRTKNSRTCPNSFESVISEHFLRVGDFIPNLLVTNSRFSKMISVSWLASIQWICWERQGKWIRLVKISYIGNFIKFSQNHGSLCVPLNVKMSMKKVIWNWKFSIKYFTSKSSVQKCPKTNFPMYEKHEPVHFVSFFAYI